MNLIRIPTVILSLALLSSCAGTGSIIETPGVSLTNVELTDASFKRQTFLLRFNVANPNMFPLPVEGVEYRVLLNDEQFAAGKTQGSFTIPAGGEDSFAISIELDVFKSTAHLASLLRGGLRENIAYELSGSLALDLPMIRPVPFSGRGVVNLTRTASGQFD